MVAKQSLFSDEWETGTNPDDVILHLFLTAQVVPLVDRGGWVALMVKEASGPEHLERIRTGADTPTKHQFILNPETARKVAETLSAAADAVEAATATKN